VGGLAPRALGDSVRPRRLSGVVVRPLNFTVREGTACDRNCSATSNAHRAQGLTPRKGVPVCSRLRRAFPARSSFVRRSVAGRTQSVYLGEGDRFHRCRFRGCRSDWRSCLSLCGNASGGHSGARSVRLAAEAACDSPQSQGVRRCLLTIVGRVRERPAVTRRGRAKTLCARVASPAWVPGPQLHPFRRRGRVVGKGDAQ
jgi:hypothetical protein